MCWGLRLSDFASAASVISPSRRRTAANVNADNELRKSISKKMSNKNFEQKTAVLAASFHKTSSKSI
jgi:PBP1b-binding outer membrane lipoprotein LpoB